MPHNGGCFTWHVLMSPGVGQCKGWATWSSEEGVCHRTFFWKPAALSKPKPPQPNGSRKDHIRRLKENRFTTKICINLKLPRFAAVDRKLVHAHCWQVTRKLLQGHETIEPTRKFQ